MRASICLLFFLALVAFVSTAAGVQQRVEGHRIVDAARSALHSSADAVLHERAVPEALLVPAGAVSLTARASRRGGAGRDSVVWVDVAVNGRLIRALPVSFQAAAAPQHAAPTPLVMHSAPASQVPTPPAAAVVKGEWATLRAGSGAIRIESRVQVLSDGQIGQTVTVEPEGATAPLAARVIGAHMVEIK